MKAFRVRYGYEDGTRGVLYAIARSWFEAANLVLDLPNVRFASVMKVSP